MAPAFNSQRHKWDWREGLPTMKSGGVTLREMRLSDAQSLEQLLTAPEVARFVSPPPTGVEGFRRFIAWTLRERAAGKYACFAVSVGEAEEAVGLFQLRQLEPGFATGEWGFALGSPFWGTGVFQRGAGLLLRFAFNVVGVHRLEARAAVENGRGNGALRRVGAVQEGVLRSAFLRDGVHYDQALWSLIAEEWRLREETGLNEGTRARPRLVRSTPDLESPRTEPAAPNAR